MKGVTCFKHASFLECNLQPWTISTGSQYGMLWEGGPSIGYLGTRAAEWGGVWLGISQPGLKGIYDDQKERLNMGN